MFDGFQGSPPPAPHQKTPVWQGNYSKEKRGSVLVCLARQRGQSVCALRPWSQPHHHFPPGAANASVAASSGWLPPFPQILTDGGFSDGGSRAALQMDVAACSSSGSFCPAAATVPSPDCWLSGGFPRPLSNSPMIQPSSSVFNETDKACRFTFGMRE